MKALLSQPLLSQQGWATLIVGVVILLHFLAGGLLLTADEDLVYFLGSPLPETCALRTAFGVPCPTCGMTRGVVFAMHGRLLESYQVNRSAPIFAAGWIFAGLGLVLTGVFRVRKFDAACDTTARWTQRFALAAGSAWIGVLAANWWLVLRSLRLG